MPEPFPEQLARLRALAEHGQWPAEFCRADAEDRLSAEGQAALAELLDHWDAVIAAAAADKTPVCAHDWEDTGWVKPWPMSPPIRIFRCRQCGHEGWLWNNGPEVEDRGFVRRHLEPSVGAQVRE
jgi:hypothetical protein